MYSHSQLGYFRAIIKAILVNINVGFNITLISDIRLEQCQKIILHKCCVWPCVYNIAGVYLVQFQVLRGSQWCRTVTSA